MKKTNNVRKLQLSRERLMVVPGALGHRTTHRCHESFIPSECWTYCETNGQWTCPGYSCEGTC